MEIAFHTIWTWRPWCDVVSSMGSGIVPPGFPSQLFHLVVVRHDKTLLHISNVSSVNENNNSTYIIGTGTVPDTLQLFSKQRLLFPLSL